MVLQGIFGYIRGTIIGTNIHNVYYVYYNLLLQLHTINYIIIIIYIILYILIIIIIIINNNKLLLYFM